jgi:purine-binding chemotaxis protein CheW
MQSKEEILKARAKKTAVKEQEVQNSSTIDVLQFSLYPEVFAIKQTYITEVFTLTDITALPGTPAYVMGVVNRKGKIICIINLKEVLNIKSVGLTEMNKIICLKKGNTEFGIVADALYGTIKMDEVELKHDTLISNSKLNLVDGVLPNATILLNDEMLLTSKALIVS